MHSYLIVGGNKKQRQEKAYNLSEELKVDKYEFQLEKISDVRDLISFVELKIIKPTAVIVKDIDKASNEALNAFLKNLEEPQTGLYFVLTAQNTFNLLPTIVSRCQIISIKTDKNSEVSQAAIEFAKMSKGEKLKFAATIKDRGEAIELLENIIIYWQEKLIKSKNYKEDIHKLKIADRTLAAINAYGNVSLQLTNMIVNS